MHMYTSKQASNTLTCSYIYVIKIGTKPKTRLGLVHELASYCNFDSTTIGAIRTLWLLRQKILLEEGYYNTIMQKPAPTRDKDWHQGRAHMVFKGIHGISIILFKKIKYI